MKYLSTLESKPYLDACFRLASTVFPQELMFEPDERLRQRWISEYTISSVALDDAGQVQSYFVWTITDTAFRDGLLSGRSKEEDLYVYRGEHSPVLFFNVFVCRHPIHAPFMIRRMTQDLKTLVKRRQLKVDGALSIGSAEFTKKWLKVLGFRQVGMYQKTEPVLYAKADSNPLLMKLLAVS